jgi:hypothetical protein
LSALASAGDAANPAIIKLTSSDVTARISFTHDSSASDPNLVSIGDVSTCTRIDGLSG